MNNLIGLFMIALSLVSASQGAPGASPGPVPGLNLTLAPPSQEELALDTTCLEVAQRNVRDLRELGYLAGVAAVGQRTGNLQSHALTAVIVFFDVDGRMLTTEELGAYYDFHYFGSAVDGSLWGADNKAPDSWAYDDFDCSCRRKP